MNNSNKKLNSNTQNTQEEKVMSKTQENGVITLQNGTKMSIQDYLNSKPEEKTERVLYLGKITNVSNLSAGRYFITPCWDKASGDDNKVAYVSCNKKLPANEIQLGLAVVFSVVEERKHPGKFMALDVQKYVEGMEVITERPEDFATNISKSRKAYLDSLHPVVEEPVKEEPAPAVEEVKEVPVVEPVADVNEHDYEEDDDDTIESNFDEYEEYEIEVDRHYGNSYSKNHGKGKKPSKKYGKKGGSDYDD